MKSNKKLAILTSSLVLVAGMGIGANLHKITLAPSMTISADDIIYQGFKYTKTEDGITITGYTEELDLENLVIPDEIDGTPVTAIGDNAFTDCSAIKKLTLGKNLNSIGAKAFYSSKSNITFDITEVVLPDNLETVGADAFGASSSSRIAKIHSLVVPASATYINPHFYQNTTLYAFNVEKDNKNYSSDEHGVLFNADKTILIRCPRATAMTYYVVPDSVNEIEDSAFYDANAITSLNLGKNVTVIGKNVFYGNNDSSKFTFTEFTVPDNLQTIGENAFGGYLEKYSPAIKNLIIPASAKYVDSVFYSNYSANKITVEEGNANYSNDENGVLFNADKTKLIRCPRATAMTSYVVPDSVTEIGNSAFYAANAITSLNLGKNVTIIGSNVFYGNGDSSKFTFTEFTVPDNLKTIGDKAFGGYLEKYYPAIKNLIIPASATYVDSALYSNYSANKITAEEGNTAYSSDENGVLFNADKTKLIRCPRATAITSYVVPDSVTEIGNSAFYDANTITSLNLGKNVTIIGESVFYGNGASSKFTFTEFTVPDNIKTIGKNAFGGYLDKYAPTIEILTVPASATYVSPTMYNNKSIKNINVEAENKKYLSDNGVLYDKEEATLIRCPQASDLLEYEILETTKIISDSAFAGTKLQVVTIHPSVYIIGEKVFSDSLNVVKGYPDTLAENYALENKYTFLPVDATIDPQPPIEPDEPGTDEPDYDLNGDGKVNVMDLLKIKKYILLG